LFRNGVDVGCIPCRRACRSFPVQARGSTMSKYQRWYDGLVDRARSRNIPTCYTEVHHVTPRSLGGCDEPENLVRLTYREHFLAHWLLTKMHRGGALRKMQRALLAMTLKTNGQRITAGWQFDAAKRAVRDLELDPELEQAWYERWSASRADYIPGWRKPRDRKSKRPGRRQRLAQRAERVFVARA
jgi:hypothetical protein